MQDAAISSAQNDSCSQRAAVIFIIIIVIFQSSPKMATMTPLKYPPPPSVQVSGPLLVFSSALQHISGGFQNSSPLTAPTDIFFI